MNFVLDTNVLVAAVRSPAGASAELLRRTLQRHVPVLCSVPLFLEYEDVLSRPEHLAAAGAKLRDVQNLLDVLAGVIVPVTIQFLWRPQLRDPKDDLVLESWSRQLEGVIVHFRFTGTRLLWPRQLGMRPGESDFKTDN